MILIKCPIKTLVKLNKDGIINYKNNLFRIMYNKYFKQNLIRKVLIIKLILLHIN